MYIKNLNKIEFKTKVFRIKIMINLIACVTNYKNKLAIGRGGNLLFKLSGDMKFFKNTTMEMLSPVSKLSKNIVLMGRKTYFSIPNKYRPLNNRINFVLTRDPELLKLSPIPNDLSLVKDVYYTDLDTFKRVYLKYNPNVFVIGGSEIYNMFLGQADNLYITHVQTDDGKDIKFQKGEEPDTFMNNFSAEYKLVGMSEKYFQEIGGIPFRYRILYYKKSKKMSEEYKYLQFMNNIITNGNSRDDRTGVGTVSLFGNQMRFDISQSIPLMTTKRVPFKTIVEELLWFCRGDTDARILQKKGIKIWDGNTSREFLDSQGLFHYPEGILGAGYGFQWRFQGAKYSHSFADTSQIDKSLIGGFDQLKYVEELLRCDPFSRRIVISAWNPSDFDKCALVPCFPAGTLVLTNNGYKNIEDVVITDKLLTHKGNWRNIMNLQQKDYNDDMYEFKLQYNSKPIKATKEHPFLVKKSGDEEVYWCEAKDITTEHMMCLPINKENRIPTFDYLRKDGYKDNASYLESLMYESMLAKAVYNSRDYKRIENRDEWIFLGKCLKNTEKIKEMFILRDFDGQRIPEWVQDAPKECIEWFIEGYLEENVECNVESADIAYGFQRLFAKLGKVLSVEYNKELNTYNMKLTNKNVNIDDDYIYYDILEINKVKEQSIVYNFEVEEDNSYTVQNVSVHNCHILIQFYVEEINKEKHLSCQFYMRSNDVFLANVFNIVSYSVLTYILAKRHNMKPKEIIYTCGDSHIYSNHLNQVKEQLERIPRPFPKLVVSESIKNKDWSEMLSDDFELVGYFPDSSIKAPMAV